MDRFPSSEIEPARVRVPMDQPACDALERRRRPRPSSTKPNRLTAAGEVTVGGEAGMLAVLDVAEFYCDLGLNSRAILSKPAA